MRRRKFLEAIAIAGAVPDLAANGAQRVTPPEKPDRTSIPGTDPLPELKYPRVFSGRQLTQIAFPLGGIGTGSISLGGRGQLRDWEIFNRPSKGLNPAYAFASIWAKSGSSKPVARVLESRLLPPYSSEGGLGPNGAPGLTRLGEATFTGEFPIANVNFADPKLPVVVSLEAFSPFIPLDAESSGHPVAVLRYIVRNTRRNSAQVSIAFSLENPVGMPSLSHTAHLLSDPRAIEYRDDGSLHGFFMTNPALERSSPMNGSFALTVLENSNAGITYLRGWPDAKWWASPQLFWDDFTADGELGPESAKRKPYASICVKREIPAGADRAFTFLLGWHFPNRTPAWCGWDAPQGHENDKLGNHYCERFSDAWQASAQLARNLPDLERRTRSFVETVRESTLPDGVRDSAMANLSTLVTQTCFRTADGEFHAFEGSNNNLGCCFGNCTHVWNYESSTQHLFPRLARSLRKAAFGFSEDDEGGMRHRQLLPDGITRYPYAAADGQMGQIIKLYLDWRLSGDTEWLRSYWPRVQRALSFAWIPGGWDANRDGVMEGVQHNTYDVEFYGPNPLCGIYYLGALRAAEEIARVLDENAKAETYHALFEHGSRWIDANLFNGEYYIQQVRSIPKDQIAPTTVSGMGSDRSENPEFQLGKGCLGDQLIGQYQADLAGLGTLLDPGKIKAALAAIYKYNYRSDLMEHDSVQRVYALNDEPALLVCDYGRGERPRIPFPYFAEAWTGMEYLVGSQMIFAGMVEQGIQCIENVRRRFDGERRNPWDEPECGHHYARAMSAWSGVLALSGFSYHARDRAAILRPRIELAEFRSIWSTPGGWGSFTYSARANQRLTISVAEGKLALRLLAIRTCPHSPAVTKVGSSPTPSTLAHESAGAVIRFDREILLTPESGLLLSFNQAMA